MVVEQIVETDEALDGALPRRRDDPARDPPRRRPPRRSLAGHLVPIVCVSARKDIGVREMLDLLAEITLKPDEVHRFGHKADGDDEVELSPIEEGELVAQVFKTTNDLFVGKLSVLRIHSGRMTHDTTLVNLRTGKTSKPGHLYRLQGKTQEEVKEAIAGDIVAVPKFDDLHISDTVTVAANGHTPRLSLNPIRFPTPMVPRAVEPKTREDEPKISAGLAKLADEDPTFTYRRDTQTHELVISGMSELHLDVIQNRLKSRYKLDINTHVPHVPYLETIAGEAEAHHRHKKQTGGRGQFADVQLRVRPRSRGEGFSFVDAVKGGVIPNQFIPADREGDPRAVGEGGGLGQPGGRRRGRGLLRLAPRGRQLRAGVQDGRRRRLPQGVPRRPADPAGADRRPRDRRPAGEVRRHHRRPLHPPRPHHRDGGPPRRPAGDQGDRPAGRGPPLRHRPQEHDRRPGLLHDGVPLLRARPAQRPARPRQPMGQEPGGGRGGVIADLSLNPPAKAVGTPASRPP